MGISTATNPWWRDVLANGPDAPSAHFFDIDWNPFKTELRRKLLLPILGDQYGQVLERGELQLQVHDDQLTLAYFDHRLPINARHVPDLHRLPDLPPAERDDVLARFNGVPGQPQSFDALHELLESQAYRLAYWRTASHEINYRRFFDVNTLAGLRVEDPDGLRVDPSAPRRGSSTRGASPASGSITRTACSIRRGTSRCCRISPPSRGACARREPGRPSALRRRGENPVGPRAAAGAAGRCTGRRATTSSIR